MPTFEPLRPRTTEPVDPFEELESQAFQPLLPERAPAAMSASRLRRR